MEVRDRGLCIGCGACAVACPIFKLDINWNRKSGIFEVEQTHGRDCVCKDPLCERVCPSIENGKIARRYDFASMENRLLGPIRRKYISCAINKDIRFSSSSGGSIRALLTYALASGQVKNAIILAENALQPLRPKFVCCSTPDEVEQASNSFYLQVPFKEALSFLRDIETRNSIIVALPCQIQAIKKVIQAKVINNSPTMIGLFCGGVSRLEAVTNFTFYSGIRWTLINNFKMRGQGWPGKIIINDKVIFDRKKTSRARRVLYSSCFRGAFFLKRCLICSDQTAELADISFGDPWIDRIIQKDTIGSNIALVRTEKGEMLFNQAVEKGILNITDISTREVLYSQRNCLAGRKLGIWDWPKKRTLPSISPGALCDESVAWLKKHAPSLYKVIRRSILWVIARKGACGRLVFPICLFESLVVGVLGNVKRMLRSTLGHVFNKTRRIMQ